METNELRIGNLVYFKHCDYDSTIPRKVELVQNPNLLGLEKIAVNRIEFNHVEPIPLTEEWLLKFGFEKIKDFDVYTNVWEFKGFMVSLGDYINIHVDWADDGVDNYHSIIGYEELYVHTLQNLYFALIGKELTFKSE